MAEKATLHVKGMSCGHCVKAVEDSLGKLEGVHTVDVDLGAGTVDVDFDSRIVNMILIKDTIEDQGYDVVE